MINRRWPGIVLLTITLVQAQGKLADPELEYPAYTPVSYTHLTLPTICSV